VTTVRKKLIRVPHIDMMTSLNYGDDLAGYVDFPA